MIRGCTGTLYPYKFEVYIYYIRPEEYWEPPKTRKQEDDGCWTPHPQYFDHNFPMPEKKPDLLSNNHLPFNKIVLSLLNILDASYILRRDVLFRECEVMLYEKYVQKVAVALKVIDRCKF